MNPSKLSLAAFALLVGIAFLAGRGSRWLEAQDRRGPPSRQPPPTNTGDPSKTPTGTELLVYGESSGTGAAANGILAVTGSYGVGTSVLYVIDTESRQMAVYEARGGSQSMRRLTLVGARRIDLDLMLEGYNDESEFTYDALRRKFEDQAEGAASPPTGAAKGPADERR